MADKDHDQPYHSERENRCQERGSIGDVMPEDRIARIKQIVDARIYNVMLVDSLCILPITRTRLNNANRIIESSGQCSWMSEMKDGERDQSDPIGDPREEDVFEAPEARRKKEQQEGQKRS